MIERGLLIHQRRLKAVESVRLKQPDRFWRWRQTKGLHRLDPATGSLRPFDAEQFQALLPEVCVIEGIRRDEVRELPARDAKAVWLSEAWPRLEHVRYAPWFDEDGRLVNQPGYDEASGCWLQWSHDELASPDRVSDAEMWDILDRLMDFDFASASSATAFVAALVQIVTDTRGQTSPFHLIVAPEENAGKSYVSELLCRVASEQPIGSVPFEDGPEQGYTLGSILKQTALPPVIFFDNIATGSSIHSARFNQIMTARGDLPSRTVGSSTMDGGNPTHTMWLGNGIRIRTDGEAARRINLIRLRQRPNRRFRTPDLLQWVSAHRPRVVSALLRLVDHWIKAGRPDAARSLDSYEWWSRQVGGPVSLAKPEWGEAWLAPSARPVDAATQDLVELFAGQFEDEQGYERTVWERDAMGEPAWLSPQHILELARTFGKWDLAGLVDQSRTAAAQQSSLGKWLTGLSQRTRPLLDGAWQLQKKATNMGVRYRPVRVDGPTMDPPSPPASPSPPPAPSLEAIAAQSVSLAPTDPAYDAVVAMAARGMPADAKVLRDKVEAGLEALRSAGSEADGRRRDALRGLLDGTADHASPILQARQTGRVRCRWGQQELGRLQSSAPNLQGVTKAFAVRSGFAAPEGHRLVIGDWRAAFVQIAAALSDDHAAMGDLATGDLYAHAAAIWFPELDPERGRRAAKVCVLAYLNGGGGTTFAEVAQQYGAPVDGRMLMLRREVWLRSYPRLRAYMEGLERDPPPMVWPGLQARARSIPVGGDRASQIRRAKAHVWQATEADALRRVLLSSTDRVVLVVHDEVIVESPAEEVEATASRLRQHMHLALRDAIEAVVVPGTESRRHYDVPADQAVEVRVATSWHEPAASEELPTSPGVACG
ncbi:MAG: DNA polymerase [Myxococcota bacterium]